MQGAAPLNILAEEDIWSFVTVTWSPDSSKLAISRLSKDYKRKQLSVYDLATREQATLWKDRDDRWVDHNIHPEYDVAWAQDGRQLAFLSNRDGWRHLYVADTESGQVQQLTQGEFECYWCGWSPDDSRIAYVSSENHPQERLLYVCATDGSDKQQIIRRSGLCLGGWYLRQANVAWSPDGERIAHVFSGPEEATGLYVSETMGHSNRVYNPLPPQMRPEQVVRLEPIRFHSADGLEIPAVLMTDPALDRSCQHPALVFAYGAWDQEAPLGWEFATKNMMLNYLAQNGFVVLLVDPRGSEGYGDAHAKGQYLEGGGKQCDDLAAAAQYLAGTGFVQPEGIALFGYSYGGYMVFQTMLHAPGIFAAGMAMAPVAEWGAYSGYSTYAAIRFGTPDDIPNLLYERSPVYHLHKLKGKILLLHGSEDFNVPLASSEALVRGMLRAGTEFEYMVYPDEGHVWTKPETIRDVCLRMERFLRDSLG